MFNTSFYNNQNDILDNNLEPDAVYSAPNYALNNMIQPQESAMNHSPLVPIQYKEGGKVKKQKSRRAKKHNQSGLEQNNPYPTLAEMIRSQGEGEDVILAHINPIEAQMLGVLSNGGTINPITGLPQYGFFKNPLKAIKGALGGGVGAVLGNMLLPGVGGILGGALGGAAGSAARGRKDFLSSGLRGAGIGAMLPSAAGFAGSMANTLGQKGLGSTLTNYGNQNSILSALGLGGSSGLQPGMVLSSGLSNGIPAQTSSNIASNLASQVAGSTAKEASKQSFLDSLIGNSKNFLTDPKNLLTLATVAGSFAGRPKEKTPEQQAQEYKRMQKALRLTPEELAAQEAYDLSREQSKRRISRKKFLPEEKLGEIEPIYTKVNSPEEFKKQGKWLNYYNNPEFKGSPLMMKEGGGVHDNSQPMIIEIEETEKPLNLPGFSIASFLQGNSGGQDDNVQAMLSDGEYVIPADVVAHLGDGNNNAGANKLDQLISKVRKHKGGKNLLPKKAKSLTHYMKA
jgi:hypothetical protein